MIVRGLLKVRASTHWLGMGQSVHRYFLMASYLSFRELDKIQTTFEEKRIFVRSCSLRVIQHFKSSLGKASYAQGKYSHVHSERKNCKVSVSVLQSQRLLSRGIPRSVLGLHRRMSRYIVDSQEPRAAFLRANPTNTSYRDQQDLKLWIQIHTMFMSGVTLCCKTLKYASVLSSTSILKREKMLTEKEQLTAIETSAKA